MKRPRRDPLEQKIRELGLRGWRPVRLDVAEEASQARELAEAAAVAQREAFAVLVEQNEVRARHLAARWLDQGMRDWIARAKVPRG